MVGDSMGGRYYLTGTQLGMLKAYCQIAKTEPNKTLQTLELLEELLQEIEDKNFIGNIPEHVNPYDYEIVIRKKESKQKLKSVLNALEHADYGEAREVLKELLKEEKE